MGWNLVVSSCKYLYECYRYYSFLYNEIQSILDKLIFFCQKPKEVNAYADLLDDDDKAYYNFKKETGRSRKDLEAFEPQLYVTGDIKIEDVIDIKEVFDTYDSTGMGVLLPNDLILLLSQNGFNPNKKTIYEIIAEFDVEEAGGISFGEFMKAMGTKPYLNETKKEIGAIFKKYDKIRQLDIN